MKKLFLTSKALLIAATFCLGTSSAWADAGDVTTNVDIDFSNFTGADGAAAPSSVTGTKGTMSLNGGYQVLSGTDYRLSLRSGQNSVTIAESERAGTKDKVTVSFEMAFTQMATSNKSVYFYIQDATNANIVEFTMQTNANSTNYITSISGNTGIENDDVKVDYQVNWDHKVAFTITLNYATGKITTATSCSAATNTTSEHTVSMTNTSPASKFVVGADYNANYPQYRCQFDNLRITTEEGDYSSSKNITLVFKDNEDNDISALYTGQTLFTPDNGSTFTPSDYYPTVMYNGEYKYTYASGGDAFTVTEDKTVTLVYTKTARPQYTVNVTANYGSKNKTIVDNVSVYEAADYTYYYPRFIQDGTTLYQYASSTYANASASYWTSTLTNVTSNANHTLTYTALEGECVYYAEGEDIQNAGTYPYSTWKQYMSNGGAGVFNSKALTTLAAGAYKITSRAVGRADDRYIDIYTTSKADENRILRNVSKNNGGENSVTLTFTENTDLIIDGGATNNSNNGHGCDYVYIMKLPIPSVAVTSVGYASFSSTYPVDFTNVTDATAWIATSSDEDKVTLEQVNGKVAANTGLILKTDGAANVSIPITDSGTTYNTESATKNYLFAIDGSFPTVGKADSGTNYVLTVQSEKVVFAPINATPATVSAGQAALWLPSSPARSLTLDFGDMTTGIESITPSTALKGEGSVYTLNGQRIANPTKGLYIVGGKKIVKK